MNNQHLRIFSSFYVDKIFRDIANTQNVANYSAPQFPFEEKYAKGSTEISLDESVELDPTGSDLTNSINIYESLGPLNEVQASDERLWCYLTHVKFWNYMKKRWPVQEADNPLTRVRDRYFLRTLSLQSLTRNGIARLWWYAHITVDNKRSNKYELLEVLLQRQDLAVGITERSIGTNSKVRTSVLDFLLENIDIASNENLSRDFIKKLNLYSGVKMLPLLDKAEIKEVLETIKESLHIQVTGL